MERFADGAVVETKFGEPIVIDSYIAGGGQGDVYKVTYQGKPMALKWYKPRALQDPDAFYDNLQKNVAKGSPDKAFLWPVAVTERANGSFGYVMELRPDGYEELTSILFSPDGNHFTSFKAVVEAAIEVVSAFRNIHKYGYSYQDMNSGNFFINARTGSVLICDNDNVAPDGTNTGIIGTPQYMAPEIVLGKAKPNWRTDEFSLAVVLFMLLCANHPLEGEHWAVPCLTPEMEKKLYGSDATFIFDPQDASNRPIKGVHNNVLRRWSYLPDYIRDAFLKAFSKEAINDPNRRVLDMDWLKVLTRFQSDIVRCPHCDNEIFIKDVSDTECDRCHRVYKVEHSLKLHDYAVTAARNTRVYRCQLGICKADEALDPVALVIEKNHDPHNLGLKNMTKNVLLGITPSGKRNQVQPGQGVPLRTGIVIKAYDGEIDIQ